MAAGRRRTARRTALLPGLLAAVFAALLTALLTAVTIVGVAGGVGATGRTHATAQDAEGDTASSSADDGDGEVVTVMARNLYLGADVGVALELLPDLPAAAQFLWEQVAATDFSARAPRLAAEAARYEPAVIGLQEATTWRCRPGSVGRTVDVFDFTADFLAATQQAGVAYVVAAHDGREAFNEGYAIPAIPFLSRVEDAGTFQPLFGRDTATCGFAIADALLVRADLADQVVAAGTSEFRDRYVVAPTVLAIDRGYAWADVAFATGTVRFVTTHLESLWDPDEPTVGAAQARQLVEDLADTTLPLVVIGDLNNDPRDPRPVGAPNPALQPEAGQGCPAQLAAPTVATAEADCNAYWTLRQAGFEDAGPDVDDPAHYTWGSSALLAGPDPARIDAALAMGNPFGFTDRLDHVLVRGGVEPVDAEVIGHQWPDGPDVWACDTTEQVATTASMSARLAVGGGAPAVEDGGVCFPTDHAGIVAQLRIPPTAPDATSPPPPAHTRFPLGLWSFVGIGLLVLIAWLVTRRLRRRRSRRRRAEGAGEATAIADR
jgi:hypothetical protein